MLAERWKTRPTKCLALPRQTRGNNRTCEDSRSSSSMPLNTSHILCHAMHSMYRRPFFDIWWALPVLVDPVYCKHCQSPAASLLSMASLSSVICQTACMAASGGWSHRDTKTPSDPNLPIVTRSVYSVTEVTLSDNAQDAPISGLPLRKLPPYALDTYVTTEYHPDCHRSSFN